MRVLALFVVLLVVVLAMPVVFGQNKGDVPDHNITEWKLGEIISGPEVKLDELQGKVVVIEFWGWRCPPCLASLPKLAKLDKKYRKKGLVLIGMHAQQASNDQILEIVKKSKLEFTITTNPASHGPVSFSGIPKVFVFDGEGKLVFDGHPNDVEKVVKAGLKKLK
ncbi:MAG: TlpA family protein disulfide reductase [Victivallales bacterium]|nr:TlpA family protein disulfide reductase [Victivallales bacterium]